MNIACNAGAISVGPKLFIQSKKMNAAEPVPEENQSSKCDHSITRPALARTNGSNKLMDRNDHSNRPKQWNEQRSSLRRQSRTKEFNDGIAISKAWKDDDLSRLHHITKLDNTESWQDENMLSHIYTLSHCCMGSAGSGCSGDAEKTWAEF